MAGPARCKAAFCLHTCITASGIQLASKPESFEPWTTIRCFRAKSVSFGNMPSEGYHKTKRWEHLCTSELGWDCIFLSHGDCQGSRRCSKIRQNDPGILADKSPARRPGWRCIRIPVSKPLAGGTNYHQLPAPATTALYVQAYPPSDQVSWSC